MKKCLLVSFLASLGLVFPCQSQDVIPASVIKKYAERFNQNDDELYAQFIPNSEYLNAYSYYWLRGGDHFDAKHGLFWQIDGYEGTELSIGGHGLRLVINSFMIADAEAIAKIAALLGNREQQTRFAQKAAGLQKKMLETLWDKDAQFFKVLQLWEKHPTNMSQRGALKEIPTLADVRELCGYAPWMFGLAKPEHTVAWKFLMDKKHFYAPFGPTFAEQSHPEFVISYEGHECQWNGPTWPMSTTMTLLGLANLLQTEQQKFITKKDYLDLLKIYAHSHHLKKDDGTVGTCFDITMLQEGGLGLSCKQSCA